MAYRKIDNSLISLLARHFPAAQAAGVVSVHSGLSGCVLRVDTGERCLSARQMSGMMQPGVSLRRHYRALKRFADELAPCGRVLESGWLVSDWLEGACHEQMPAPDILAGMLAALHRHPRLGWRVSVIKLLEWYWLQAAPERRSLCWLRGLKRLHQQGEPRPLRLAPLHMDIHPGNIIHQQAGVLLIDWEYAADGDIALELAAVVLNMPDQKTQLLSDYAHCAGIDYARLCRQVARWRPWVVMLMAGWYEYRWRETRQLSFLSFADEAWRLLRVIE